MKKEKNELLLFLGGIGLLLLGLLMFSHKVIVTTSFFGRMSLGGFSINSGVMFIPLIIGIVWMFANPDSLLAKAVSVLGVAVILFTVILSTNVYLRPTTMFEWVIMLILIFGGVGLLARVLFMNPSSSQKGKKRKKSSSTYNSEDESYTEDDRNADLGTDLEEELEKIKKRYDK